MALRNKPDVVTAAVGAVGMLGVSAQNIPPGFFRLSCASPPTDLLLLMGEDSPRFTAGWGGWSTTPRPRQVGMTTWDGVEPYQATVSIMLDGFAINRSVGPAIDAILAITRGESEDQPGVVHIEGIRLSGFRWVINGIDFGDAIYRDDGVPLRQALTLTLLEYLPPAYKSIRKGALKGTKGRTKVMKTRKGDTAHKIAVRQKCKASAIIEMNPALTHGKVNYVMKTGTKLRVPTRKEKT